MDAVCEGQGPAATPARDGFAPGPVFYIVIVALGLGLLALSAYASFSAFLVAVALFLATCVAVSAWLVMLVVALRRTRLRMVRRTWARWMGIPAVAVLCIALAASSVPFRLRFELSRPAFEQAVARFQAGETIGDGNFGLFQIDYVDTLPNGFWFEDQSLGFIDPCGLAYSAHGQPSIDYLEMDLGGGWWLACERF